MKALTLWQPWASAIGCGAKTVETRSWGTGYRGPLAIHAGKHKMTADDRDVLQSGWSGMLMARGYRAEDDLPLGAVVATCTLFDVVQIQDDPLGFWNTEFDHLLGDYTPGRFAWLLRDVRALPTPLECNGHQGLWECPLL